MANRNKEKQKIPRILSLKILFGDDFIDYIKEEYGMEKFLEEQLNKHNEKSIFLKTEKLVKEFSKEWILFTAYYKKRFGQQMRDRDAITKLSQESSFKNLPGLYKIRCALFKVDFTVGNQFKNQLRKGHEILMRINRNIAKREKARKKYFIKNKEWSTNMLRQLTRTIN